MADSILLLFGATANRFINFLIGESRASSLLIPRRVGVLADVGIVVAGVAGDLSA